MPTTPTTSPVAIVEEDALQREGQWLLVRRSLGIRAFGVNLVDVPAGGSLPAHREDDPAQEELYAVLSGHPIIRADGADHPVAAGSFLRFAPEVERSVHNPGPGPVRLLMVSAPVGSGFAAMEWA